jgi:peptidyl-tRNA hydrolase, PTH2 family
MSSMSGRVMSERVAKQVIVMRKDLNMRKGKMIAQGAHASLGVVWMIEDKLVNYNASALEIGQSSPHPYHDAYWNWRRGKFTKICVYVNSEKELLDISLAAIAHGLR